MGVNRWRGDHPAVAQVDTCTVGGTVEATDLFILTINGKALSVAAGSTTLATVAANIVAAWNASEIPEFAEITAAATSGGSFTLTADTAGRPFTVSLSTTEADGSAADAQTFSKTSTTSNSGPNVWGLAGNWSLARVPAGACSAPVQAADALAAGGSLTDGVTYYYKVTATNPNGETTGSNEQNATPTGADLTVVLSWAQVNGATGYKVYRGTVTNTQDTLIATITSGSTLTFSDTGGAGSAATVPVSNTATGDDVYFESSDVDVLYDLDQSTLILASLNIAQSYTGKIGLPAFTGDYYEYRGTYLAISATTVNIGDGAGGGSGRLKLNTGTNVVTMNVRGTGSPVEDGIQSLLWIGAHASNVLNLTKGSVGIAVEAGQTATVPTIRVGFIDSAAADSTLRCGPGVTLTDITMAGGTVEINSGFTTLTTADGSVTVKGSGTMTTITLDGGTLLHQSSGTITTLSVGAGGTVDRSGRDLRACTITNCTLSAGAELADPGRIITFTNGIKLSRCGLADVKLTVGEHLTLSVAAF